MLSYACQQSPSAIDVQLSTTRDALADAAAGGFVAPVRRGVKQVSTLDSR
jgi:hypothetical protein